MNVLRLPLLAAWLACLAAAAMAQPRVYELSTSVVAGSVDNQVDIVVSHSGASDAPVEGVRIAVAGSPRYLTDIRVTPEALGTLRPGERSRVAVKFNVRRDAPQEQVETLALQVTAADGSTLDYTRAAVTMRFVEPVGAAAQAAGATDLVEVVNVRGLHLDEVAARLRAAGLTAEYAGGTPAPTKAQEYTAQDQSPREGSPRVPRGSRVVVTMHSEYLPAAADLVLLERLIDLPQARAEERLTAAGLLPDYIGGGLPSRREQEYTVESQNPPADGRRVARGSVVTLAIRSGFVEPAPATPPPRAAPAPVVPYPPPPPSPVAPPPEPRLPTPPPAAPPPPVHTPAPAPPPPRAAPPMEPAESPLCPTILATARMASDSGRLDDALNLYSQARAQRCNAPWIDGEVARIQGVKAQNAQRARQCDDLIQRGNQASYASQFQAAANLYSQARQIGCNNAGLNDAIARAQQSAARQQEQLARCNGLVQAGNQANNAGRWQEAINYWRQAQGAQCNVPGIEGAIAGADNRIRQAAEAQARARAPAPAAPPAPAPGAGRGGMYCECRPGSVPHTSVTLLGQSETACRVVATGRFIQPDYNCRRR